MRVPRGVAKVGLDRVGRGFFVSMMIIEVYERERKRDRGTYQLLKEWKASSLPKGVPSRVTRPPSAPSFSALSLAILFRIDLIC